MSKEICRCCGRPLAGDRSGLCATCSHTPPSFSFARAATFYSPEMRAMIHEFKYAGRISLGKALGKVMAGQVYRYPKLKKYTTIIPVPLHPESTAERGFNQALILAGEVADTVHRKVDDGILLRLSGSAFQHTLLGWQRRQGLAGEFHLADPGAVQGKKVLLIDDVLTTGSTLNAAARVLLRAGAEDVAGYVLAVGISEKDGY